MAVVHALVLALALLAVVCLPAAVAAIICADELIERFVGALAEWRTAWRDRRTIRRLDRAVEADSLSRDLDLTVFDQADRMSIERIAADLHRLGGQRLGRRRPHLAVGRSSYWHEGLVRAYDERLRMASRALGVAEHLADLDGFDLEIERIRVEGELQAAGLHLPTATTERRREQR
ncbi:hypothetical protein GCM10027280_16830 [Micromonospora polyrhachis]|uniref:Uncharacterized protein n=1 Tax=Micromonospora polyrhachis TaxID=1282883 RepID=A0A7W7WP92_9ACTN|nr:hypothetical protein [Micromonospora polyrhachis]MBB4958429.1 hypothetical protein [Micromonospora polyrhachis]